MHLLDFARDNGLELRVTSENGLFADIFVATITPARDYIGAPDAPSPIMATTQTEARPYLVFAAGNGPMTAADLSTNEVKSTDGDTAQEAVRKLADRVRGKRMAVLAVLHDENAVLTEVSPGAEWRAEARFSAAELLEQVECPADLAAPDLELIGQIQVISEKVRQGKLTYEQFLATPTPRLEDEIHPLRADLCAAAQRVLDEWEQDENGIDAERGSGGACDAVSNALSEVLVTRLRGIGTLEGGQDGDDHSSLIVHNGTQAIGVDIPPSIYEVGSGYVWRKRSGVVLEPDDVAVYSLPLEDAVPKEDIETVRRERYEAYLEDQRPTVAVALPLPSIGYTTDADEPMQISAPAR